MSDGAVVVKPKARDASKNFLKAVNNDLPNALKIIDNAGRDLSDPQNWQGGNADRFRLDIWPKVQSDLTKIQSSLKDLQGQVDKVLANIMKAGGNG